MKNGKKMRRFMFLFVTAADEAQFKYDGEFEVPRETRKQWAVEIERAKVDILVQRMRDRTSFSYWLQWLQPLVCAIAAALDPQNLIEYLLMGFGGATMTNVARKVSKHVYLTRAANSNSTNGANSRADPEPEALAPESDEPDDGANAPATPDQVEKP